MEREALFPAGIAGPSPKKLFSINPPQTNLIFGFLGVPCTTPLKIWHGATFSKGCHTEFGCWGPQLNFLFRDFNHHLLVGGGGRLGGRAGQRETVVALN